MPARAPHRPQRPARAPGPRPGQRPLPPLELFAACAPGLSGLLAAEVRALGVGRGAAEEPGGVTLQGDYAVLARLNLSLRTASRVLVRLGSFEAKTFAALVHEAGRLPFERVLRPGQAVALRVTCKKSKLYHSDAVAERVLAAIGARLGRPAPAAAAGDEEAEASAGPAPQTLVVRFDHDRCTVSADSSGALLHRRGYRTHLSQAPLRETLAAALLLAAGYSGGPLLDPCCGGGTLPLEGALLSLGRPPGLARAFACEAWPGFDPALLERLRAEAGQRPLPPRLPISGSDLDPRAVAAARHNASGAGLAALVRFHERALQDLVLPEGVAPGAPGLVACNPPYGLRVGEGTDLRALYAGLGKAVRERLPGWRLALVCADDALAQATGTPLRCAARTENGGTKVGLWVQP